MLRIAAALAGLAMLAVPASASDQLGIVLLHDKDGTPQQVAKLAGALGDAGYVVATPEMCWSKNRIYDHGLKDCLAEVDTAIADLKTKGATRIVVGGASLGALAAFAYGSTHRGLAGIIGLAPSPNPPTLAKVPEIAASLATAKAAILAHNGDTPIALNDQVAGTIIPVTATPKAYLDFLSPYSPLSEGLTLPRLTAPLLWVIGNDDETQRGAPDIYAKAPKIKGKRYAVVHADHEGTPDASVTAVLAWLKTIAGP